MWVRADAGFFRAVTPLRFSKTWATIPLLTVAAFHIYAFWLFMVEGGRVVMMRPHYLQISAPWRWFNRVSRAFARVHTRKNASVIYNCVLNDIFLEAPGHFQGLPLEAFSFRVQKKRQTCLKE